MKMKCDKYILDVDLIQWFLIHCDFSSSKRDIGMSGDIFFVIAVTDRREVVGTDI